MPPHITLALSLLLLAVGHVSEAWVSVLNLGRSLRVACPELTPRPWSPQHPQQRGRHWRVLHSSVPGRVSDPDDWIRCISNSLKRFYGKSLFEELGLGTPDDVHANERFVVISHGTQEDPIYNYANQAGLLFFGYSEREFVQLPSRYSAPEGALRMDRSQLVQTVLDQGWAIIPEAIRQNKNKQPFLVRRILYFNVYDDEGVRIGQAATFDREHIEPAPESPERAAALEP